MNVTPKQRMIPCNFYATFDLYQGIKQLADKSGLGMSEHFRQAIALLLEKEKIKPNEPR